MKINAIPCDENVDKPLKFPPQQHSKMFFYVDSKIGRQRGRVINMATRDRGRRFNS